MEISSVATFHLPFISKSGIPKSRLHVIIPDSLYHVLGREQAETLRKVPELDPRSHYQPDPGHVYGMPFGGRDIHFRVEGETLTVVGQVYFMPQTPDTATVPFLSAPSD